MNSKKFLNRLFRRIHGLTWDVITGSVGLQTENGIYTVSMKEDGTPELSVNPIEDFGLALPAFATQSAHADVQPLDIIVGDQGIIGWVLEKTASSFKVLDHNGHTKTYTPPKVAVFGNQGVLVVRNLLNLTGGANNANSFASSLLPLMMLGGGDAQLEKMLPLLLLSSQGGAMPAAGGGAGGMNAMLPFLLMKDGGLGGAKDDKLMMLAMMGGLGGGAGGMNPLMMMTLLGDNSLFSGGSSEAAPAWPAAPAAPALRPRTSGGVPTLNRV